MTDPAIMADPADLANRILRERETLPGDPDDDTGADGRVATTQRLDLGCWPGAGNRWE